MRGIGVAASLAIVTAMGVILVAQPTTVGAQPASTTVGATVCSASSSVTLTTPVNDSVVADPNVPLAGTVDQASQIDVYIDDVFDHVLPLTIGQASFSDMVQLTAGTHTVKVVAITTCPGGDGSASSIVTYTPPPVTPSNGGSTSTNVDNDSQTESPATGEKVSSTPATEPFPQLVAIGFNEVLKWLNINVADSAEGQKLSLWRAVVMGAGTYLLVIGMAVSVVKIVAGLPLLAASLPDAPMAKRNRWVAWSFRIFGLLLVLAALFL